MNLTGRQIIDPSFCTCPELTWDMATGIVPAPDWQACRDRAPFGIDPHPVIDPRGLGEILWH